MRPVEFQNAGMMGADVAGAPQDVTQADTRGHVAPNGSLREGSYPLMRTLRRSLVLWSVRLTPASGRLVL
jgi:hypothetical protein